MRHTKILSGSSHPGLADKICERLGMTVSETINKKHINGEMDLTLGESMRGEDVFIVQSGAGDILANDSVMELCLMISACKMSSAKKVTAVIPFFPYSKQCKKKGRGTVAAKLVANMLVIAGVDHILTMDLHASLVQGFFKVPVDSLFAEPTIAMYIEREIKGYQNGVVVAKNPGAMKRVTSMADRLGIEFALIQKVKHIRGSQTETEWTLVGDCKGKIAFILDDMIDSIKTFLTAVNTLKEKGAEKIHIVVTHGLLSDESIIALDQAQNLTSLMITNTVPLTKGITSPKIHGIDITPTLSEAVRRTHNGESVSFLFNNVPQ
jgi:ribose-phosphate pyrophosphokinase